MRSCVGLFLREQIAACLRESSPNALSTSQIASNMPTSMGSAVYRALRVLERLGEVVRCEVEGTREAYWGFFPSQDARALVAEIGDFERSLMT